MLQKSGERQVGVNLEEIRDDHKERYIWARSRLDETDIVLDAGCGVGYGSALLSERVRVVTAVDVSEEAVAYGRRYWARQNVNYAVQDLHFLDRPSETHYDAVVAFEIIEHLVEPRLFLLRVQRFLRANGRLFISVPNEKRTPHTVELNPFHMRHYTAEEVSELLSECGYEINAILSQDARELTPGTSGNFLVVEATSVASQFEHEQLDELCKAAVTTSAALIVARAAALNKAKKDLQSLKVRLDDAAKTVTSITNAGRQNEFSATLELISQRIQTIEASLISDLRQRNSVLELAERSAKDGLAAAQFQVVRLEDEKRWLTAELARSQERAAEQVLTLSKLQTEISSLSSDLEAARADAARLAHIHDSVIEYKIQLDQLRATHILQLSKLEGERAEAVQTKERMTEERNLLRQQVMAMELRVNEGERLRQELQREYDARGEQIAGLERALSNEEKFKLSVSTQLYEAQSSLDAERRTWGEIRTQLEAEADANAAEIGQLKRALEVSEASNALLSEECGSIKAILQRSKVEHDELSKAYVEKEASLKSEVDSRNRKIAALEQEGKRGRSQMDSLTKALNDIKRKDSALSIKLLAVASENDVLRKASESLANELEQARHLAATTKDGASLRKEPPSVGYLWRKMTHHKFYVPFLTKAIRNSLGLKRARMSSYR